MSRHVSEGVHRFTLRRFTYAHNTAAIYPKPKLAKNRYKIVCEYGRTGVVNDRRSAETQTGTASGAKGAPSVVARSIAEQCGIVL